MMYDSPLNPSQASGTSSKSGDALLKLLKANKYLPIVVDGDIVELAAYAGEWQKPNGVATVCVVEVNGRTTPRFTYHWGVDIPLAKLPKKGREIVAPVRYHNGVPIREDIAKTGKQSATPRNR